MIYGINFTNQPMPAEIKRRFAARVRVAPRRWALLIGVGQSEAERDAMLATADNGHRELRVEVRKTRYGPWYGIYAR